MNTKKIREVNGISVNKLINMIPGTLVYKGDKTEKFMIERFVFDQVTVEHEFYQSCSADFNNVIKNTSESKIQWINVTGIHNIDEIHKIGKTFQVDNMILEQVLNISKHSLYKNTEAFIFNDLQMIQAIKGEFSHENISIYFSNKIILIFQERQGDIFDSIRDRIMNNYGHIRNSDAEYTYFSLIDAIVDHYIYSLEEMKTEIEEMEVQLMENQSLKNQSLHRLRKQIMLIRMSATPLEKLIQELLVSNRAGVIRNNEYYESLHQHTLIVNNEISIQKETVDWLYENYMMTNSNDMNHIMTILTIFSAVFIPLSFLAGVFGMNFTQFPGLNNIYGFYYFIIGCFVTALLMILYFKKKKWF